MTTIAFRSAQDGSASLERISAHSHIRGLGLNELLEVVSTATTTLTNDNNIDTTTTRRSDASSLRRSCGLVGQEQARRALGVVVKLIRHHRISGRSVLLAGPPSTGKTALATALSAELGEKVPFVELHASQVFSQQISPTEVLTQAIRRAVGVQITEETEIIQGEVVEIQIDSMLAATGSNNSTSAGRLVLCTTEMETVYDLGSKMIDLLRREKISAGDVIQIDKSSSKITKLGRSFSRSRDYDAVSSTTKFVATPEGELLQRRQVQHVVSLHEMDVINSRQDGFLALFAGDTGEIRAELRDQVDAKVAEWREEGRGSYVPGVLFIDEVHGLDLECFSFLNIALESASSPLLVLATNRGLSTIRGTEFISPHGIPLDLLDRLLIIPTLDYTSDQIRQILLLRCDEEDVTLDAMALELLCRIAAETSLRYAMQLIMTSSLAAAKQKRTIVSLADVERVFRLFFDTKRSTKLLLEYQQLYMFNELNVVDHENNLNSTAQAVLSSHETKEDPSIADAQDNDMVMTINEETSVAEDAAMTTIS